MSVVPADILNISYWQLREHTASKKKSCPVNCKNDIKNEKQNESLWFIVFALSKILFDFFKCIFAILSI